LTGTQLVEASFATVGNSLVGEQLSDESNRRDDVECCRGNDGPDVSSEPWERCCWMRNACIHSLPYIVIEAIRAMAKEDGELVPT